MQAASNYIRNRAFAEALHVLNDIPFAQRTGKWYYYSAVANAGTGNNATAIQHIDQAVTLEPSNMEYRQALNMMQQRGGGYRPSGYTNTVDGLDCCTTMLCLNCLCGGGHC